MSMLYGIPLTGAYHVVTWISTVLTPALGTVAAAAAIVVFTCLVRLLIMPLSYRAMRGQAAQARLAPQVRELRQRHRKNPERMQRELGELYRREGVSMLAGFGPLLAQAPFLSVVYLLFRSSQVAGHQNTLLTRSMLHVPLGMHWLSGAGPDSIQGLVFLGYSPSWPESGCCRHGSPRARHRQVHRLAAPGCRGSCRWSPWRSRPFPRSRPAST